MNKPLTLCCATLLTSISLIAETKTWVGGDGLWYDPEMWEPVGVPVATDDILIADGTCTYVPGGDCNINGSLTLGPGGKWIQTGDIAWIQLRGALILNGGIFDTGSAQKISFSSDFSLTINSGTLRSGGTLNVDFVHSPNVAIHGGLLEVFSGEFQFNRDHEITYNLTCPFTAAQGSDAPTRILHLRSGHTILTTTNFNGMYGKSDTTYFNFPEGSTAVLTLAGYTLDNVYENMFAGTTPYIRYIDEPVSPDEFAALFTITESTDVQGVDIALTQLSAGAASFVDDACYASDLTATSVTFSGSILDPGTPAADVFLCYGASNGGTLWEAWTHQLLLGTASAQEAISHTLALEPDTVTYYRLAATNSSGIAFALPSPGFVMSAAPSLALSTNEISEASTTPIQVTISRPATCTAPVLQVPFTLGGTTTLGTHYTLSTQSPAVIPAGASSVTLDLLPKPDWLSDATRTLSITLDPAPNYLPPSTLPLEVTLLNAILPAAPTNTFLGTLSSNGADPNNWSLGHTPTDSETVLVSPLYATNPLTWPASITRVGAWTQPLPFPTPTYCVTFETSLDAPLQILGDCSLEAGVWTHSGPAADPTTALAIHVGGNLTVGTQAILSAGLDTVNLAYGYSRGYLNAGPGYAPATGASFAGEGPINATTYGSILNPLSYGSSGTGDGIQYAGAGIVALHVDGSLTLNGRLTAIGFGYNWDGFSGSSGGSINVTCARLLGSGEINANGGLSTTGGSGSGGRIRVKLTDPTASFDDFDGTLKSEGRNSSPSSAAGTIALQTALDSDASALVIVSNPKFSYTQPVIEPGPEPDTLVTNSIVNVRCTHLPATLPSDPTLRHTRWELHAYANLRLTQNVLLESLSIPSPNAHLYLNGYTLSTKHLLLDNAELPSGTYTALDLPEILSDDGAIEVLPSSTLILFR